MNLRIEFSPEVLNDIEEINKFLIAEYGIKTSSKNIKKVMKSIKSLGSLPLRGSGVWERYGIASYYRYIYSNHNYVFYRVEKDSVKIIRILDARSDFIKILFGIKTQTDDSYNDDL